MGNSAGEEGLKGISPNHLQNICVIGNPLRKYRGWQLSFYKIKKGHNIVDFSSFVGYLNIIHWNLRYVIPRSASVIVYDSFKSVEMLFTGR